MRFSHTALLAILAGVAQGHPGHDISEEVAERRHFINSVQRKDLSHCSKHLRARGFEARNIARRSAAVEEARVARAISGRDLSGRDLSQVLAKSHDQSSLGYTAETDASKLFSGNSSCLLTPEVTQGPYYVGGELVRKEITDSEPGVPMTLDYQVVDVNTCEPVPNVYVEIWHCNSTGVYSGVVAGGNGNSADGGNLDTTFLRGIQETDSDGVAQFKSIFPGHYTGRATHIHIMVHANATLLTNQTLGNDVYASHVGQAFFDQTLVSAVERTSPYSGNTQELTQNEKDDILAEEADGVDPLMKYVYLGNGLNDGLLAWLAFGINTSYASHVTPAVEYYEGGGVANEQSGQGRPGGSGGKPGNGKPPGGSPTPGSSNTTPTVAGTVTSAASASVGGGRMEAVPPYGALAGGIGLAVLL